MFRRLVALISFAAFSTVCWADSPDGWRTYRSPEYGFTVSYPASFRLYASGRRDGPGGYSPICFINTVTCLGYIGERYAGTNFEGAGLVIDVLREARTEQQCDQPDNTRRLNPAKSEIIHGIHFQYSNAGGGGLSHFTGGPAYRVFYQHVCFEVAAMIASSSFGAYDPGAIKEFHPAKLEKLLGQMVHTIRFAGPVRDGPAWKVSFYANCGGQFEYPDADTVRTANEDSNATANSNRVTCSRYFTHQGRDYTLAVKNGLPDIEHADAWLRSTSRPGLYDAQVAGKVPLFTDYKAAPYY